MAKSMRGAVFSLCCSLFLLISSVSAGAAESAPAALSLDDAYITTYEIFVYSFADSNGDGIGDLKGIREKLDYIGGGGLGCSAIWLTPVFPSPTYHKYDVTEYRDIDPQFGTLGDFDDLVAACHERGIRVIMDLPVNHTASSHPWFKEAAAYLAALPEGEEPSEEACPYVSYYHFSRERQDGYEPLSDEGGETGWYYEARFWAGMPDLNLDSEAVRDEIARTTAFWQDHGADGFRLDAVTSFYTGQNDLNRAFIAWLVDTVKTQNENAYLVGEAWTDQGTYASYYESGIDSLFDFAFASENGLIAEVVRGTKSAARFGEAMEEEEALYRSFSENYVNAPFYTNHDMARSAGYYAWDDGSRTKLGGALNLLMTGNAFVYYGEELGMKGAGKDENKRAPMYWSDREDDSSMCAGPPEMDDVSMKFPSFEEQKDDPYSVWNYYREAIGLRNRFPAIARGQTEFVPELSDDSVCVFMRGEGADRVLVAVNTSEEERGVEIGSLNAGGSPGAEELWSLAASLEVSENNNRIENGELTLAPFGIAVCVPEREGER